MGYRLFIKSQRYKGKAWPDDKVGLQLFRYMRNYIDLPALVENLKYVRLTEQYYFGTERAVDLLKNTDLSVKEVAYLCGYHSSQYFSRVFRQYAGVLPQEIGRGKERK